MKLKNSTVFILLAVLMQSASSLSSAGKINFNVINDSAEHQSLSQAVIRVIRSLVGDRPSAMDVIKVTSHDVDAKNIDLFVETIVRNVHGLFEYRIRDYDETKVIQNNALVVVSETISTREIEQFLVSCSFESHKKVLIVLFDKNFSPLKDHIKLMLDIMWTKFILNVNIVRSPHQRNGDVLFHTYFPFTKDFCGQVHPVVWNIYRNGAFKARQREHFPRKNENLFQCPLNVAVFHQLPYMFVLNQSGAIDVDGVDGNLLKTLSTELNFALNYIVVSEDIRWGELYDNKSATGAVELVSCRLLLKNRTTVINENQIYRFSTDQSICH